MKRATVISISDRRRVDRAIEARRVIEEPGRRRRGGRAWINGVELGEERPALSHLYCAHD